MIHCNFKYCYLIVSGGFEEEVAFKITLKKSSVSR